MEIETGPKLAIFLNLEFDSNIFLKAILYWFEERKTMANIIFPKKKWFFGFLILVAICQTGFDKP